MARIRYLKMGFFENEDLASLSPHHRLTFQGLWLIADKAGRLEDRPKRIHAKLFPYEAGLDIDSYMHDLAAKGFIARYVVGNLRLIQVLNFLEHQRPRHDEPASVLPAQPIDALGKPLKQDGTVVDQELSQVPPVEKVNVAATDRTLRRRESPPGIGIGMGIGMGMGGPHLRHAACGKVCLHESQYRDLYQRVSHLDNPEKYVRDWARGVLERYTDGDRKDEIVGDDMFDFWRKRWAETHPTKDAKTGQITKRLPTVDEIRARHES